MKCEKRASVHKKREEKKSEYASRGEIETEEAKERV
jgi:hypothetical protein